MKKHKRHTLEYGDYDAICFEAERWDLMDAKEQRETLRRLAMGLLDMRDLFLRILERNYTLPKPHRSRVKQSKNK